ncbi:unnamed protein product [Natator depressus]
MWMRDWLPCLPTHHMPKSGFFSPQVMHGGHPLPACISAVSKGKREARHKGEPRHSGSSCCSYYPCTEGETRQHNLSADRKADINFWYNTRDWDNMFMKKEMEWISLGNPPGTEHEIIHPERFPRMWFRMCPLQGA